MASSTFSVAGFSSDHPRQGWVSWIFAVVPDWSPQCYGERRDERIKLERERERERDDESLREGQWDGS